MTIYSSFTHKSQPKSKLGRTNIYINCISYANQTGARRSPRPEQEDGGVFSHVSLLREHRLFLLVSCFVRSPCLPWLFCLLSAGSLLRGQKPFRFFTLMLLVVTPVSHWSPAPGTNKPGTVSPLRPNHGRCFEHSLVNGDVLPRYSHFYSPCTPQKCPRPIRCATDAAHP